MNGISNGDGTYRQLSNSDALVGKASDLPNPSKSVTESIKDLSNAVTLCSLNATTTATARTFTESANNFYFVEVRASWGSGGAYTTSMLIPSDTWAQQNGGSDGLKVFLNNAYSTTIYAEITKRTADGCTITLSNSTINVNIRGVMRKV